MRTNLKRVVHRFTVWGPPAAGTSYCAVLGIAATAAPVNSDAKAFLDSQIAMLRDMSNAPYVAAWVIGIALLWLFAFLWSLEHEAERDAPPLQWPNSPEREHGIQVLNSEGKAFFIPVHSHDSLQKGTGGEDDPK